MVIGLTGGMGCGKSTAARIFEEFGFRRVDSDALVRDRVLTSPDIIAEARRRFGNEVLDAAGRINRAALARALFADETKLHAWEDLVLPRVFDLWRETFAAARASPAATTPTPAFNQNLAAAEPPLASPSAFQPFSPSAFSSARWIVEAPLLHEKNLEKWFDFIVCVASSTASQYARLAERGVTHTLAAQRISKQLPLAEKINKADYVLSNDGTLEFLRDQIRHLVNHLPTIQTTN